VSIYSRFDPAATQEAAPGVPPVTIVLSIAEAGILIHLFTLRFLSTGTVVRSCLSTAAAVTSENMQRTPELAECLKPAARSVTILFLFTQVFQPGSAQHAAPWAVADLSSSCCDGTGPQGAQAPGCCNQTAWGMQLWHSPVNQGLSSWTATP
jgi:hypothetical protein